MKKLVFLGVFSVLFGYQLGVKAQDAEKLRNFGLECKPAGEYCIYAIGSNKESLLKVEKYIRKELGIESYFVNNTSDVTNETPSEVVSDKTEQTIEAKQHTEVNTDTSSYVEEKPIETENVTDIDESKKYYSYQVISSPRLSDAKKAYEKIKNLPYARIEKIGNYYVVRVGLYDHYREAKKEGLKYMITRCFYKKSRIIKENDENGSSY
ncbi:SPOR domain-containing protein [Caminibacter pacificus]